MAHSPNLRQREFRRAHVGARAHNQRRGTPAVLENDEFHVIIGTQIVGRRDILPLESSSTIAGYQVKGIVTGQDGLPINAVNVRVYYYYGLLQNTPIDTLPVLVTDSTKIVDIAVYTSSYHLVREIFLGYRSPGRVPHYQWDGRDDNNKPVPNGKYLVRYVVDTAIVKFSTIIIDGHISFS